MPAVAARQKRRLQTGKFINRRAVVQRRVCENEAGVASFDQTIVSNSSIDPVGSGPAAEYVTGTTQATQAIVAFSPRQCVGTSSTNKVVIPTAAVDPVVPPVTNDEVVSITAVENVVTVRPVDRVVATGSVDRDDSRELLRVKGLLRFCPCQHSEFDLVDRVASLQRQ